MRIIAGKAGSQRLGVPPSITRPTTDRVREAVFSSLGDRVPNATVLDLFAGSGSLGIEALSRGADSVIFVDENGISEKTIQENLRSSRLEGGRVTRREVLSYLNSVAPVQFDLVFADPPYARTEETTSLLESVLQHKGLAASVQPDGLFILESFAGAPLPESKLWTIAKEKVYGKTRVSYLSPNL